MSSLIWGILLILLGAELIIKGAFGIHIPVFRIAFGLFLIYAGITFLTNIGTARAGKKVIFFGKKTLTVAQPHNKYQIVFGEGVIDLSGITVTEPTHVEISTVFGSGIVKINPEIPTRIIAEAVFANAELPDNTQISFGRYTYTTGPAGQKPLLEIRAKVTFGSLIIHT